MKIKKLFWAFIFLTFVSIFSVFSGAFSADVVRLALASQNISAKALTDHECNANEWHFVINQVDTEAHAPYSITVFWGSTSEVLPLDNFTGGVAHYKTTNHLDLQVTSATASIYDSWSGQFNLSHGPCGNSNPTPTPTYTPTPTITVTPSYTPTPTPTCTPTPTPNPTATPTPTPTVTVTLTPTPTPCTGQLCIHIECDGGGTCEFSNTTPTPTPIDPTVTPTPTPGSSNSGSNNNNSTSNNNSSGEKAGPTQSVLGASTNTLAGTGTFEDTFLNFSAMLGSLLAGLGIWQEKLRKIKK